MQSKYAVKWWCLLNNHSFVLIYIVSSFVENADCISAGGYDTKLSDDVAPVQELRWLWSTSSLKLLPGALWLGVVVPVRGQVEIYLKRFNYEQTDGWY